MIDLIALTIKAGSGGDGKVSFLREKYVPKGGPDGGHGGDGGSVVLVGTRRFNTLKHYAGKKELIAPAGVKGGKLKKSGPKGEDLIMEVPLGTVVWLEAESEQSAYRRQKYQLEHTLTRREVRLEQYYVQKPGENPEPRPKSVLQPLAKRQIIATITQDNQRLVLCQGGFGGRGNIAFKSSANTTPLQAERGSLGEEKQITLELKLLADLGLVGYPNAGKSTLLAKITRANPKTASYPFTTIEPNLGVLSLPEGRDLVVADIPGLIEGASQGKGLGLDFLRHIENSQALLYVLFLEEAVISDESLSDAKKADQLQQQYQLLQTELGNYHQDLLKKPFLISVNKLDLYSPALVKAIEQVFSKLSQPVILFSGFTGQGIAELTKQIQKIVAI